MNKYKVTAPTGQVYSVEAEYFTVDGGAARFYNFPQANGRADNVAFFPPGSIIARVSKEGRASGRLDDVYTAVRDAAAHVLSGGRIGAGPVRDAWQVEQPARSQAINIGGAFLSLVRERGIEI